MKRKLLKTFLLAAGLLVGGNAWATDVLYPTEATIIHANGKDAGTEALSTVNYYNKDATTWTFNYSTISGTAFNNRLSSYGGSYIAIVKFDASSALSGKTLTRATLKFHSACTESTKNSNVDIALIGTGWTASSATWDNTNTGSILSPVAVSTGTNVGTSGHDFSIDVYSQLNDDLDKVIAFAFYTETGREQQLSAVTLEVESSTETLYTASFTENNSLSPTVTIYSDEGRLSIVSNGTLKDKTTYYYRAVLHGYQNYEGSFTVNGANPSISFAMTDAEKVSSLKVYAKVSSTNYLIKTYELTDKYIGDVITIYYPRFYLSGTTLYSTAQETHNDYYNWNYTLNGNDAVIEYNTEAATNVVYYIEGENIEGMTADESGNANIRCSDGQGGRSTEELSLTSLGVGQYKLTSRVWGNTGVSYTYKAAGGEILTHALTGALDDKTVCFNVVSGTAAITVQGSTDTGSKVLDYVYIQKLDEEDGLIYNGNFDNSTWDKGWNGTGTTKSKEFVKQNSSQRWATDNFAEMWTDGSFSAEANLNQILVNVPAGSYTLSANILNNVTSSDGVLYAKVGSASDVTTAAENGSGSHESVSFNVAATSNVVVGFKTTALNGKNGWIAMDNFELKQTAVSAAITSAGWATFSSAYDLDFSTPITGLTAYKAVSCDGNTVTLEEVTGKVKAGDGLVIKGAQGTYPIPVTTDASTVYTDSENINMWGYNGNATKTVEKATTGTHYVLSIQSGNVVFAPIGDVSATLNPGQAALWVKNFGGARVLNIVFADEATAISAVQNSKEQSDEVYNLAGQRVAQPTKGLYIVNGKKVIMK